MSQAQLFLEHRLRSLFANQALISVILFDKCYPIAIRRLSLIPKTNQTIQSLNQRSQCINSIIKEIFSAINRQTSFQENFQESCILVSLSTKCSLYLKMLMRHQTHKTKTKFKKFERAKTNYRCFILFLTNQLKAMSVYKKK